MTNIERLHERARTDLGRDCVHVESVHVREDYRGSPVWEGEVEVFESRPADRRVEKRRAYAFSIEDDDGKRVDLVVLGVGPITGPKEAVRAALAAEIKRRIDNPNKGES